MSDTEEKTVPDKPVFRPSTPLSNPLLPGISGEAKYSVPHPTLPTFSGQEDNSKEAYEAWEFCSRMSGEGTASHSGYSCSYP